MLDLDKPQIMALFDFETAVQRIHDAYVASTQGNVQTGEVVHLTFPEANGDCHVKSGSIAGTASYVIKIASGFYDNPAKGLPSSNGMMLAFSAATGETIAILRDEGWLTDMRTAAAGAVAARHLAPPCVDQIGVIGTGVQARMQLEMLCSVVEATSAVIWGRNRDKVEAMIKDLSRSEQILAAGLSIRAVSSVEELTEHSRVIVTATSARTPLLFADQVRSGTHITAMGSDDDGKQELEAALLGRADRVVADSVAQCREYGECVHGIEEGSISRSDIVELGAVVANPHLGRTSDDQITVADLTGVAVQDIQIAKMVARARSES